MPLEDLAGGFGEGASLIAEDLRQERIRSQQEKIRAAIQQKSFDFQLERDKTRSEEQAGIREQGLAVQNTESLISSIENHANNLGRRAQIIGQTGRNDPNTPAIVQNLLQQAQRASSLALAMRSGQVDPNSAQAQTLVQQLFSGGETPTTSNLAALKKGITDIAGSKEGITRDFTLFRTDVSGGSNISTRDLEELATLEEDKNANPLDLAKERRFNDKFEEIASGLSAGTLTEQGRRFAEKFGPLLQGATSTPGSSVSAFNLFVNAAKRGEAQPPPETGGGITAGQVFGSFLPSSIRSALGFDPLGGPGDDEILPPVPKAPPAGPTQEPLPDEVIQILGELNLPRGNTLAENVQTLRRIVTESSLKAVGLGTSKTTSKAEQQVLKDARKRNDRAQKALGILQPKQFQITPLAPVQPNVGPSSLLPGLGTTSTGTPGAGAQSTFPLFQSLQRPPPGR